MLIIHNIDISNMTGIEKYCKQFNFLSIYLIFNNSHLFHVIYFIHIYIYIHTYISSKFNP